MREQHFDLFALMARAHVLRCCGNSPSNIACRLMDATGDFSEQGVWAAALFHRAFRAVCLPGSKDDGVGFRDM